MSGCGQVGELPATPARTRRDRPWRSRAAPWATTSPHLPLGPGRREDRPRASPKAQKTGGAEDKRKTPACRRTKSSQETYKRTKPATYQTSLSHKRITLSDKWSNPAAYRTNLSHKRTSRQGVRGGGNEEENEGWDEDGGAGDGVCAGSQSGWPG